MKKLKGLVTVILLVCLAFSLLSGCARQSAADKEKTVQSGTSAAENSEAPKKQLKIRVVNSSASSPVPQDSSLENYVEKLVREKTGVTVEYSTMPPDTTIAQYLSMVNAANNVPEVLNINDLPSYGDAMDYIGRENMVYEMTADIIRKNLPNYTSQVEEYGQTLETIVEGVKHTDGKNYYVNWNANPAIFPKLKGTGIEQQWGVTYRLYVYHVYFRDDILKKIYPNAKSAEEMKQLYLQKGDLTVDDIIGDIPIRNMEDMYGYLKKVKELNLKVGDKSVIPGALNASSQSVNSVFWSLHTAMGLLHRWPLIYSDSGKSFYAQTSDKAEDYIGWLNKMYNEKLMDPEIFVMKDDQYRAKAINGEYAVINCWLPVDQAKEVAAERGYGYRYFPVFYPLDRSILNNQIIHLGASMWGIAFTKSIKEEDLQQVMQWADFYFGKESDDLAFWGLPEWYTGEGADRRYKPEYKELENWTVYGKSGGKDGAYYGVLGGGNPSGDYGTGIRPVIKPFSFFGNGAAPNTPYYVYERDITKVENINIGSISHDIVMRDNVKNMKVYLEKGWSERDLQNVPEWVAMEQQNEKKDVTGLLIKAIVGSEGSFQKNWNDYVKTHKDSGLDQAEKIIADMFDKIYKEKLQSNEIK